MVRSKASTTKIVLLAIIISSIGLVSWYVFQTRGPHDGTVNKVENFYIEMRNDDKIFHTWLYDNKFKPINNSGITGDVKFFLMDSTTFAVGLKPFLEDEFICESIPGFYLCEITFNLSGISISSTFQNPIPVVGKQ